MTINIIKYRITFFNKNLAFIFYFFVCLFVDNPFNSFLNIYCFYYNGLYFFFPFTNFAVFFIISFDDNCLDIDEIFSF
jgi:hypothetical protein